MILATIRDLCRLLPTSMTATTIDNCCLDWPNDHHDYMPSSGDQPLAISSVAIVINAPWLITANHHNWRPPAIITIVAFDCCI